jgi:hypothetical protein
MIGTVRLVDLKLTKQLGNWLTKWLGKKGGLYETVKLAVPW